MTTGAHPGHPIQCFLELRLSHTLAGSRDVSATTLTAPGETVSKSSVNRCLLIHALYKITMRGRSRGPPRSKGLCALR